MHYQIHISTHVSMDKMAAFPQTIFSNVFSWKRTFLFWFELHRSLFLRVQSTISGHWFRQWLSALQPTIHNMNQCWPSSPTHIYAAQWRYHLTHWPIDAIGVNIGSGNSLLPDYSKPLHESMLILIGKVLWHSHESNFTARIIFIHNSLCRIVAWASYSCA